MVNETISVVIWGVRTEVNRFWYDWVKRLANGRQYNSPALGVYSGWKESEEDYWLDCQLLHDKYRRSIGLV